MKLAVTNNRYFFDESKAWVCTHNNLCLLLSYIGMKKRGRIRAGNKHIFYWEVFSNWFGGLKKQGNEPHFRNQRELKEWSAKPKLVTFPWTYLDDRGVQKCMSQFCVPVKHTLAVALTDQQSHVFLSLCQDFGDRFSDSMGLERELHGSVILHYKVLQIS